MQLRSKALHKVLQILLSKNGEIRSCTGAPIDQARLNRQMIVIISQGHEIAARRSFGFHHTANCPLPGTVNPADDATAAADFLDDATKIRPEKRLRLLLIQKESTVLFPREFPDQIRRKQDPGGGRDSIQRILAKHSITSE
jgi:hypothetical protein